MPPRKVAPDHTQVVGYVRVSTEEQADSGLGLAAQRAAIEAECAHKGWTLVEVWEDHSSGKTTAKRDGLVGALDALRTGMAGTLMVSKLDRLSRSMLDFATLVAEAQKSGWNLALLDLGVDMSTPNGEFMAGVIALMAQYERRLISQRTKDALAVLKAQGVKLGRPTEVEADVVASILEARADGIGWHTIAKALNADAVPCVRGGTTWYPMTVRRIALANGAK